MRERPSDPGGLSVYLFIAWYLVLNLHEKVLDKDSAKTNIS